MGIIQNGVKTSLSFRDEDGLHCFAMSHTINSKSNVSLSNAQNEVVVRVHNGSGYVGLALYAQTFLDTNDKKRGLQCIQLCKAEIPCNALMKESTDSPVNPGFGIVVQPCSPCQENIQYVFEVDVVEAYPFERNTVNPGLTSHEIQRRLEEEARHEQQGLETVMGALFGAATAATLSISQMKCCGNEFGPPVNQRILFANSVRSGTFDGYPFVGNGRSTSHTNKSDNEALANDMKWTMSSAQVNMIQRSLVVANLDTYTGTLTNYLNFLCAQLGDRYDIEPTTDESRFYNMLSDCIERERVRVGEDIFTHEIVSFHNAAHSIGQVVTSQYVYDVGEVLVHSGSGAQEATRIKFNKEGEQQHISGFLHRSALEACKLIGRANAKSIACDATTQNYYAASVTGDGEDKKYTGDCEDLAARLVTQGMAIQELSKMKHNELKNYLGANSWVSGNVERENVHATIIGIVGTEFRKGELGTILIAARGPNTKESLANPIAINGHSNNTPMDVFMKTFMGLFPQNGCPPELGGHAAMATMNGDTKRTFGVTKSNKVIRQKSKVRAPEQFKHIVHVVTGGADPDIREGTGMVLNQIDIPVCDKTLSVAVQTIKVSDGMTEESEMILTGTKRVLIGKMNHVMAEQYASTFRECGHDVKCQGVSICAENFYMGASACGSTTLLSATQEEVCAMSGIPEGGMAKQQNSADQQVYATITGGNCTLGQLIEMSNKNATGWIQAPNGETNNIRTVGASVSPSDHQRRICERIAIQMQREIPDRDQLKCNTFSDETLSFRLIHVGTKTNKAFAVNKMGRFNVVLIDELDKMKMCKSQSQRETLLQLASECGASGILPLRSTRDGTISTCFFIVER